ncbi:MAG: preprotein translocase subunit SecE [Deltaproteobacteria bacterium]|nr:preprotein translocase subunit SecE [Deltaproteobacteria bacterium]
MISNKKWILLGYTIISVLVWITFAKFFSSVFSWFRVTDTHLIGPQFRLSTLLGLIVTLGALIYCVRSPLIMTLSDEIIIELRKVSWPTRQETYYSTLVVIITVLIMAVILGIFDAIWLKVTNLIYY